RAHLRAPAARPASGCAGPGPRGGGRGRRRRRGRPAARRGARVHDDGAEGDHAALPVGPAARPPGGRGGRDRRGSHPPPGRGRGGRPPPAGADVVVAPWITHRHPGFWDQPLRFDPERFTPERERARHRYAWFPFGGGPRACIGQHFSMLESVIALAMLVREFEFAAPPGEPARTNHITLQPTHGVPSRVTAR